MRDRLRLRPGHRGACVNETDSRLVGELRALGRTFGPLGVALAAAELTDPAVLITCLQQRQADEADQDTAAGRPEGAA